MVASVLMAGCGSSDDRGPQTIRVPSDAGTIQKAVDRAKSGDLVLVAPGVYREQVEVRTPRVVIRGEDRNRVILDGEDRHDNGIVATADGVAVENLTVRRYRFNGVLFTGAEVSGDDEEDHDKPETISARPVRGYRASFVTAYNNGLYGVYAFVAQNGRMDHIYASGHPDSGVYIGQCKPCNAVVEDSVAELNAIGFEGTNASNNVFLLRSTYRRNRVGIVLNTGNLERLSPQEAVTVAGNLVVDNNDRRAPSTADGAIGVGIALNGGERNEVVRNRVSGHANVGILVTDYETFIPSGNEVRGNDVRDSGDADLSYAFQARGGLVAEGNCFAGNRAERTAPADIEARLPCDTRPAAALPPVTLRMPPVIDRVDYRKLPPAPPQPNMPGARTAPPRPALGLPGRVNVDDVALPGPER